MVCQVQLNSIKFLQNKGATDDVRRIINEDLFNKLNDQITALAETKYGLKTDGTKLFSTNMSEHVDPQRSTYWRDAKYRILRAEPNVKLFERLQDLYNARPDQPMMMRGQSTRKVILPLGTSGSGKSTWIKSLPADKYVVISPDEMRVEFTGDMNDKSKDNEIYEEVF
jgi:hypothetical protein